MTQERYQEAAEHVVREGGLTHTCETCRVALEALSKLASGWVLVPAEPVAWRHRFGPDDVWRISAHPQPQWVQDHSGFVEESLYAAAPKP